MKVRDLLALVESKSWKLQRIRGSHRQYRHPEKPESGTLTIAGHPADDVPKGTLNAILKQAGLKKE